MDQFLKDIGMWLSFESLNVSENVLHEISEDSHDLPDYSNNPYVASIEEIYIMLKDSYER